MYSEKSIKLLVGSQGTTDVMHTQYRMTSQINSTFYFISLLFSKLKLTYFFQTATDCNYKDFRNINSSMLQTYRLLFIVITVMKFQVFSFHWHRENMYKWWICKFDSRYSYRAWRLVSSVFISEFPLKELISNIHAMNVWALKAAL